MGIIRITPAPAEEHNPIFWETTKDHGLDWKWAWMTDYIKDWSGDVVRLVRQDVCIHLVTRSLK